MSKHKSRDKQENQKPANTATETLAPEPVEAAPAQEVASEVVDAEPEGEAVPEAEAEADEPAPQVENPPQGLRQDGPTIEAYVAAGYLPGNYPPAGYAEMPSQGLEVFRATGKMPEPSIMPADQQDLRNAVLTGKLTACEAAKISFGLEDHHILGGRDVDGGYSLVTGGGVRLRWPDDEGRVLTASEKGDDVRVAQDSAGIKRFEKKG